MKNYWLERKSKKQTLNRGMSELKYNGVTISMILTQAFEQDVQYDDSGCDYLYTKMRLRVQGVINEVLEPSEVDETPAETLTRVRGCLLSPRQTLIYSAGDINDKSQQLIVSPVEGYNLDANNGPKPISVTLTQVTPVTFICTYEVETYINECCNDSQLPYLSNRWRETHDIDQNGYTTRRIEGQVTFDTSRIDSKSNPGNPGEDTADEYRGLLAPPNFDVLTGFIRESQKFTTTEDGRQLHYSFVDKQQYCFMDPLVTRFEGVRTVRWSGGGGKWNETIVMRAWAPPTVHKATLMTIVMTAAALCLDDDMKVSSGSVVDHIEENFVEVSLTTFTGKTKKEKQKNIVYGHVPFEELPNNVRGIRGNTRVSKEFPPPNVGLRGTYELHNAVLATYQGMCKKQSDNETIPGLT
jgi:hypothetical protein